MNIDNQISHLQLVTRSTLFIHYTLPSDTINHCWHIFGDWRHFARDGN